MNFKINHILIENFRCFDKLETDLWGRTRIEAANEAGKTGLVSAILWALTGKDADGNSTFEIVPYGEFGRVSPSVTLECEIDERPVTLRRLYKAKFARDKSFTGYATETSVNGLSVGVKAFQDWISQNICQETVFKILSSPKTFVENPPCAPKELTWQAQRRFLMSILGDELSDYEIAQSSNKWIDLVEPVQRYGDATKYLAFLKKQYSDTQKQLDSTDVRIEQQEKNIKPVEHTEKEIEETVEALKRQADQLNAQNEAFKRQNHSDKANSINAQIEAFNAERKRLLDKYNEDSLVYERTKAKYQSDADTCKAKMDEAMELLNQSYLPTLQQLKEKKIKENCPTCGAKLNPKSIAAARQELASRIRNGEAKIAALKKQIAELNKKFEYSQSRVNEIMCPVYPAKADDLEVKIHELTISLASISEHENMPEYADKMDELESQMESAKQEYFTIKANSEIEKSIQDIESERKETVSELSKIQKFMDLVREFVSMKCKRSEESINGLFENVKFKLFEQNKSNDEVRETCILTFNGHEYKDLSASTKIIASLEVISAFQKFYNVYVPICCDNMESVTGTIKNNAQLIMSYVKEETCPNCSSENHSRRLQNGKWKCFDCGNEFEKHLNIKEG